MSAQISHKPVVLTGIKPSGKLNIGHYIGAVNNWRKMIEENDALFFIADLHCLTTTPDPAETAHLTRELILWYISCGLDPARCHIFLQSHVQGHTELGWILGCLTPVGQLERMTQYKDYLAKGKNAQGGLLYYPVLMAADILIYNADKVPVGDDQKQHVELCRDLAEKFNRTYCPADAPLFRVPEPIIAKVGARIMSLKDPEAKMSKSDDGQDGNILLEDSPEKIRKKIMSAVTDSGSEIVSRDDKPGIKNLLTIVSALTGKPIAQLETEYKGMRYGDFKKAVADVVVNTLAPIQARYAELKANPTYLDQVLREGAAYAQPRASATMQKVYQAVGLLPKR
jgi:tryptophanyl-tRNA synthetase